MPRFTRRRALQAGGLVLGSALAGCSLGGGSTTPRLAQIRVTNAHDAEHVVQALVLDDGDPIYWESTLLPPGERQDMSGHSFRDLPSEPGEYEVYVRTDDDSMDDAAHVDLGEYDRPCFGLDGTIFESEEPGEGWLDMYQRTDPDFCEDEDSLYGSPSGTNATTSEG
jgi:hypothetical protein